MNKYLKIGVIFIAIVCIFWIHPTFASGSATTPVTTGWVTQLFNAILKFLSWGWMIMAFLAGKLMSNDFIYGTFIHLDSALFQMWNYMKNIANFILGFLFLFGIMKSFFTKDAFEIKTLLPKYLLAGVLIQMSWFMMGALVDLANIGVAAVGAFPQQFIQGSTEDQSKSKWEQLAVTVPVRIDVSFKPNEPLFSTHEGSQKLGDMFGRFNDMSGPLLFIGASIFRFQDYDILNPDISNWKNFSISLFLKLFLLLAFTVPMFVLVVINLIRIFRLWMWVVFSPIAALMWSFGDKLTPGFIKDMGSEKKLGFGKLSDVLALIFQPVAMIGSLSLAMILSVGIFYVLGGDPGNQSGGAGTFNKTIQQLQIDAKDGKSTMKDLNTGTEITVEGDLFKNIGNFVGGMIGYLIVTGFSVVLIWSLIKVAASFSTFTKKSAEGIFKWSETLVATAPLIPLTGGMASLSSIGKVGKDFKQEFEEFGANKRADQETALTTKFWNSSYGSATKKGFGINDQSIEKGDISAQQASELKNTGANLTDAGALEMLKKFMMENPSVNAQSRNFSESFTTLMDKNRSFRSFMLKGAHLGESLGKSDEAYEKGKKDLLNANTDTGRKILSFLAYSVNGGDKLNMSAPGDIPQNEIEDFLSKKLGTPRILSITPLIAQAKKE